MEGQGASHLQWCGDGGTDVHRRPRQQPAAVLLTVIAVNGRQQRGEHVSPQWMLVPSLAPCHEMFMKCVMKCL